MRTLLPILLITGHFFSVGQESIQYELLDVEYKKHNYEFVDNIIITESYKLDGLIFLVGKPSLNSASWTLLIERNKKVIGQINGLDDSYYFKLKFFKTLNKSDPILILGESASEFYWGQKIIKIEEDRVVEIGDLNVGHMTSPDEFESIIKYLDIKKHTDNISINFKCNDLIIDPETKNERRVKLASQLSYIMQGDSLLEVDWKN